MRMIGTISDERAARRFSDALYVQGIANELESEAPGKFSVWVKSDDDLPRATALLGEFAQNAGDPAFNEVSEQAAKVRAMEQADLERYRKRVSDAGNLFPSVRGHRFGLLTYTLIFLCVALFIYLRIGDNKELLARMLFTEYRHQGAWWERLGFPPEVRVGEVWRIFTPIFLHFGLPHIIFNSMGLSLLGSIVEGRQSPWLLARLVIGIGIGSNFVQYVWTGYPVFGGMSGVIYGLLGYIWIRSKFDPACGLYLSKETLIMALIFFFVCLVGLIPGIANGAHFGGLAIGMAWGWLASTRRA